MRIRVCGPGAAATALDLAAALGGAVLDAAGRVAAAGSPAGRGPDARDVLAGRATVTESFRTLAGVPVVGWGGPLTQVERVVLARRVECELGAVVVLD